MLTYYDGDGEAAGEVVCLNQMHLDLGAYIYPHISALKLIEPADAQVTCDSIAGRLKIFR